MGLTIAIWRIMAHSKAKTTTHRPPRRRMRGFEAAALLAAKPIRTASESRGFAVVRLLTNWEEIVGPEFASRTRPVRISHGRGFGATLTLLVQGAQAPLIEMELPKIRERVNACYGFNAVARITLTQTAASGFSEGQAQFSGAPATKQKPAPSPEQLDRAEQLAGSFSDPNLAAAIRQMALNTLSQRDATDRKANS